MPTTITPQIVNETVTVSQAPQPSQLQQSGALVSVGGTTLATNAWQFCGSLSAVQALLSDTGNASELSNMATTYFAQGSGNGIYVLELGANTDVVEQIDALGTWIAANPGVFYAYLTPADWDTDATDVASVTITDGGTGYTAAPTVTFSAATGGGTTATGTATINASGVVTGVTLTNPGYYPNQAAPTVTFSAPTSGTTATGTAVMGNAFDALASTYAGNTAKTYFFGTTSATTVTQYSSSKSLFLVAPAPTAPSTEFTAAAFLYQALINSPSASNQLAPMQYRFLFGVTPWEQNTTNNPLINTILSAYGNIVLTGAQGGISDSCIFKGTVMSGIQFSNWYGLDNFQINANVNVAAAVLNGSNSNPPLLYNQAGINALDGVAQQTADNAVRFGTVLNATVTATPFAQYTAANPSDYQNGIYNGLYASATAQNGFLTITFNINVTEFAS